MPQIEYVFQLLHLFRQLSTEQIAELDKRAESKARGKGKRNPARVLMHWQRVAIYRALTPAQVDQLIAAAVSMAKREGRPAKMQVRELYALFSPQYKGREAMGKIAHRINRVLGTPQKYNSRNLNTLLRYTPKSK